MRTVVTTPTGNGSGDPKTPSKARLHIAFGLTLVAVCVAAFLYIRSNRASDRDVRLTSSSAVEHTRGGLKQEENTQGDGDVELQKSYEEARAYFAEMLPEYRKQTLECIAKRRQIQDEHPLIAAAFEFGVNQRQKIHQKYKKSAEKWNSQSPALKEQYEKLNPQNLQLLGAQLYLNALGSTEQVGNTTLGAIAHELLDQTEQFEIEKADAIAAVKQHLHDEALAASISKIEKPEELIEALHAISARFRPQIDRNLQAMSPDAEVREYLEAVTYANGVFDLMQSYRQSWTAELDAKSKRLQVIDAQLRNRIQSLPQYSKERAELEQQFADAYADFESARNGTPKK